MPNARRDFAPLKISYGAQWRKPICAVIRKRLKVKAWRKSFAPLAFSYGAQWRKPCFYLSAAFSAQWRT
jgi:hypothetical protein